MAEYYPLLAKAVGSLPNSTLESRRVIYERARKALIGQLRTLHPPVPDDDIERESTELDRAVERLEGELANGMVPPRPVAPATPATPPANAAAPPPFPSTRPGSSSLRTSGALEQTTSLPLRTKMPSPRGSTSPVSAPVPKTPPADDSGVPASMPPRNGPPFRNLTPLPDDAPSKRAPLPDEMSPSAGAMGAVPAVVTPPDAMAQGESAGVPRGLDGAEPERGRLDVKRPIAPQPPTGDRARRRLWIIPVGIGLVVAAVAVAAWELRDTRQTVARAKPTDQTTSAENGKIAERIGGSPTDGGTASGQGAASTTSNNTAPADQQATSQAATTSQAAATNQAASSASSTRNPEVPVAHRAALLVEAPDEPNKVKTFLGTVVWKLNNVNEGQSDGVGLAVQADIDLPDDKMKATVTFEKNTDASLPASHTIKVNFTMQPGSMTGDVQQISVPQLRQEDSPSGEPLAGVTVPVVQNSFLVGLSPGNAEGVNIKQLKDTQWIDIPMLLNSGKIAKLTFEKGDSGARDLNEAIAAWQKS